MVLDAPVVILKDWGLESVTSEIARTGGRFFQPAVSALPFCSQPPLRRFTWLRQEDFITGNHGDTDNTGHKNVCAGQRGETHIATKEHKERKKTSTVSCVEICAICGHIFCLRGNTTMRIPRVIRYRLLEFESLASPPVPQKLTFPSSAD